MTPQRTYSQDEHDAIMRHNATIAAYFDNAAAQCPTGVTVARNEYGVPVRISQYSRIAIWEDDGGRAIVRNWEALAIAANAGWLRVKTEVEGTCKFIGLTSREFTGFDKLDSSIDWLIPFDVNLVNVLPPAGWQDGHGFHAPMLNTVDIAEIAACNISE